MMSSLLPLLQDLLPMILPSKVHITKAKDLKPVSALDRAPAEAPPTSGNGEVQLPGTEQQQGGGGVVSKDAIVDKTDKMCAAVMIAKPKSASAVYHNAEQDAIIYAASGTATLATHPEDDDDMTPVRREMAPGDFALVPPWTEHQMVNESDEEVVWIVIRSGPSPTVVNLTEWGGPEAKAAKPKK